jgi:hypothetical protein
MSGNKETIPKKRSLVIILIDNFTKKYPLGKVYVTMSGQTYKALKNPSGNYLFLNIPIKTYTPQIKSDFYIDQQHLVQLLPITKDNTEQEKTAPIVKQIILEPKPNYPFPNGTTLIRGIVTNQEGKAVPNAKVTVAEKSMTISTTEKGEYVFYFKKLTSNDITIKKDNKRFLKPQKTRANTTVFTIEAKLDNKKINATINGLEEGTCQTVPPIKLYTTS